MSDIGSLIQSGATNLWVFIPTSIALGALHGLEPGHSKTMMAAFIIAVKGTVFQAILLGLAATVSHTAVVWAIALSGLHFGSDFNSEATEPYLQLVSAVLIVGLALWMIWRTRRNLSDHHHHDEKPRLMDFGHGNRLAIDISEEGIQPHWRIECMAGGPWKAADLSLITTRPDGSRHAYNFLARDDLFESVDEIPEPHEFRAELHLNQDGNALKATIEYHEHEHDHETLDLSLDRDADAHAREHAMDIQRRFKNRDVTTSQIIMFGLTGGLIPCPASVTILLLCLQLKKFTLGATLVLCFSVGLALTMVSVGTAAAMSVHHVRARWSGFDEVSKRAPYLSGALVVLVGLYTGYLGLAGLAHHG